MLGLFWAQAFSYALGGGQGKRTTTLQHLHDQKLKHPRPWTQSNLSSTLMFYEERKRYQHGKCGPHFNGIHINLQIDAGTNRNECKREHLHWTHTNSAPRGMCLHKNQARLWFSFSLLWLLWWTLLAAAHTRTHNLLTRSRTPLLNQRSNTVLSLHMSVYTPMLLSYCQRGWLLNMELTITLYSVLTISVVSSSTIYPGWDSHHIMSKIFGLTTCLNQSTAKLTAGGKFSSRFWIEIWKI